LRELNSLPFARKIAGRGAGATRHGDALGAEAGCYEFDGKAASSRRTPHETLNAADGLPCSERTSSFAGFGGAEIFAEEWEDVILEAVGDGAGVGAVINLEAVGDAVGVEDFVELRHVEAEAVLIADVE
jgi:hypothetical protein